MTRETLKVAVVGLGKMGLLHASILNVLPEVDLIAICEKSSLVLKLSKKLFDGVHTVDDSAKLSCLDLGAVYVTTPIPSHSPIVRDLYLKEITDNIFVEKTLASGHDEAKELCILAQSSSGINMAGYMKRYCVTFKKAKNLITKKTLGEITSFKAYAYSSDFVGANGSSKTSRGGPLKDLGCHVVDLALWFFDDFQVVSVKHQASIEEDSEAEVYFKVESNDLEGEFKISRRMPTYRLPEVGLLVEGSKGIMKVNDDKVTLELNDRDLTWYRHDLNDNVDFCLGAPEYYREDKSFVNSVMNGSNAQPDFRTASKVDRIIDQVSG